MRAARYSLVLASGVQGGGPRPPAAHDTLLVALLVAAMTGAGVLAVVLQRRRKQRPKPVIDQWQASAVMGELCAHGWQAQITVRGWGAPVPTDAPPSRVPLVELEWKQFDEEPGRVTTARRVWAPTIAQALQGMVDDRRTAIAIEQIERASGEDEDEDGAWWGE